MVEGVSIKVNQSIIDRYIMEEVKKYRKKKSITFYDYKKAYDKGHHDCVLCVYGWKDLPKEVIELIYQLMGKRKTRLVIWNK